MNSQLTDVRESSFIYPSCVKILKLSLIYRKKRFGFLNKRKGKNVSTKTVIGGMASEYDDQILWIEKPEVGAAAAQIVDEREYTPCKITKIISESDFDSEEEYAEASDALLDESDALCTGEFITMDGAFFVEMDAVGDTEEYESVDFDDVDFC